MKNVMLNIVSGFISLIVALVPLTIIFLLLPRSLMADGMVPEQMRVEALFQGILHIIIALLFFYPVRKCVYRLDQTISRKFIV